ncbi:hypothetical protein D4Q52_00780 [Rhodopseudomonas palustris]|uniref:Uncharacterized protein n=1 Tax=Rhodopseudomonas palustris TaxID=1076 RepID=A0A418VQX8_RHOPL|nr:hypothetical protein D4Q52_00780 [Rhodopseudomonas palustris]
MAAISMARIGHDAYYGATRPAFEEIARNQRLELTIELIFLNQSYLIWIYINWSAMLATIGTTRRELVETK